jgi:hypothetical protein
MKCGKVRGIFCNINYLSYITGMIWKQIKGYEGLYEITNTGLVRSIDRMLRAGPCVSRIYKGKMKKTQYHHKTGQPFVYLYKDNKVKLTSISRLVATTFITNPNNYPIVMHLDDNPKNNHYTNLMWGTLKMNTQDMIKKGRNRNGKESKNKPPFTGA